MGDEPRQPFTLLPGRSDPSVEIAKPGESRVQKFIRGQSLPTGALAVKGPAENELGRTVTFGRYPSEPMVDERGLPDPSPGHDGYNIYMWVCPGRIQESEVLSSTKHFASGNGQSGD